MDNNVKIVYKEKEISDEEIDQYKDFDGLIQAKTRYVKRSNLWKRVGLGGLVIGGLAIMLHFNTGLFNDELQPESTIASRASEVPEPAQPSDDNLSPAGSKVPNSASGSTLSGEKENIASETSPPKEQNAPLNKDVSGRGVERPPKQEQKLTYADKNKSAHTIEFVDAHPKDGFAALYEYFESELVYPEKAIQENISGTVIAEFTVSKSGSIENIKIIKSISTDLDEEAKRLISQMPEWVPATYGAETFPSKQTIPLTFHIK